MGKLLTPKGDVKNLIVYRKAELLYDLTYYFCRTFLSPKDRTSDQMIQAARSGKQNIAEGNSASLSSKESEIKLINVAKASFNELLLDYEDFLRVRNMRQWENDSEEIGFLRKKSRDKNINNEYFLELAKSRGADVIANMAIAFLKQEDYLLHRHLEALEQDFLQNGGLREKMYAMRLEERNKINKL